jgi:hypothetical protein
MDSQSGQGPPGIRYGAFLAAATSRRPRDLPLRLGPAPSRVEFDNDEPSWREDCPKQAHKWVVVRSTQNAQVLTTADDIELKLRTTHPIKRELKLVAPRGGGNRHALTPPDPCHAVAVEQNSIGPSRSKPSS